MFGEHPISDAYRAARAIASNQVARFFPDTYISMTGETGRGREQATAEAVAHYFNTCFDDYLARLGLDRSSAPQYLAGKNVLEYGPGDTPGVALLFVAFGANSATCVDRFALSRLRAFSVEVLQAVLEGLPATARRRADQCFIQTGRVESGFATSHLNYLVRRNGLSGEQANMSLVVSRAVLEHVNDLRATFADMAAAMKPDALALHQVDLKSHGLHQRNPLDFLTWPNWLWNLMYSEKGVPNRLRPDSYRAGASAAGLQIMEMSPTGAVGDDVIREVRPHLAAPFKGLPDEDLACQGFWLKCRLKTRALGGN